MSIFLSLKLLSTWHLRRATPAEDYHMLRRCGRNFPTELFSSHFGHLSVGLVPGAAYYLHPVEYNTDEYFNLCKVQLPRRVLTPDEFLRSCSSVSCQ